MFVTLVEFYAVLLLHSFDIKRTVNFAINYAAHHVQQKVIHLFFHISFAFFKHIFMKL